MTPEHSPRIRGLVRRLHAFEAWTAKRRKLFWTLHSLWALATGVAVVLLAHENYRFVPWVFGMLLLTWVSTLFFCWFGKTEPVTAMGRLGGGFVSYLTRVMYQETLFFLLPFYAYSTGVYPVPAWNAVFLVLLMGLAVLSCLDLVFDRLVRSSALFGLCFFAAVAFATLNLLLPIVFRVELERATQLAAAIAVASAFPLSFWRREGPASGQLVGLAVAGALAWGVPATAPLLVPPVPLRVREITFARDVVRQPLRVRGAIDVHPVASRDLGPKLAAVVTVFAPTQLRAAVRLVWQRDGQRIRESRTVEILGHRDGFRVWDALVFEDGRVPAGAYTVEVFAEGRALGSQEIRVVDSARG